MTGPEEQRMRRFFVDVELTNYSDLIRAKIGLIHPDRVRRTRAFALVGGRVMRFYSSDPVP